MLALTKDVAPNGVERSTTYRTVPVFADEEPTLGTETPNRGRAQGLYVGGVPVFMDAPSGDED